MESIYQALKILDKYEKDQSEDIVKYINYANKVNKSKPKYELDHVDVKIIKCIMNPNNELNTTKYGSGDKFRTEQGIKVKEVLSVINMKLEDEYERIYGLIISGYIEPLIPITSEISQVSDAITKLGIKSNTKDYAILLLVLYKCAWLVEQFGDVDLSLSQEGYEAYIRILFNELHSYEENVNKIVKETATKNNEFTEKIKESEKKLEIVQKNLKDSTTQSITILSIFAGVVMAFTGGMSYISQALAALNSIGPYRAGIFIVLIGSVMFNLIFLLLYMIGKLTDRYIGSYNCKGKDPNKGCTNRTMACCIKRYPYIIWFNLISLMIILTIVIVLFLDKYDLFVHRFIDIVTSFAWYKLFQDMAIIACVSIIYIAFALLVNIIWKIECKNNEQ
ncbi:hypothetical protein psyc5s11_53720 [Clostridium gelidum]|uniref:Uncharacterized protein n=1 Tax=Clostridium gelidum TaxID=704125 RepID=A0ABM7TMJ4_9CLOT|nr:hypothetical protein [Clostridium gelidum]BCZ49305.1 hypothetical protein psyc5s11_53720 [Clostridium gelidum]